MRLALDGDTVVADLAANRPGRGAYVCGDACLEAAIARRALHRAFRRSVSVGHKTLESVRN